MANIIEQRVDESGFYVKSSDGRELFVSSEQIKAVFDNATGTLEERKAAVFEAGFAVALATLGAEQINPDTIRFDFDPLTGIPTELEIS